MFNINRIVLATNKKYANFSFFKLINISFRYRYAKMTHNLYTDLMMSDLSPLNRVAFSDKLSVLSPSKYIKKTVQFLKNKTLLTLLF